MDAEQLLSSWWKSKNVYALCKYYFNEELKSSQLQIVRTVAFDEHKRVVICCMTRYGKSFCVAMGILLWIMHNKNKKIAIIAPTNEKTGIIRNYIADFVYKSPWFLNLLDIEKKGAERIKKEVSRKRMTWKNGIEMRTLSAEGRGEALMGFGADKIIVDETCDIDYEVYRARVTRMLGDNKDSTYVEIGNPNHKQGHMFEHWTNPDWFHIHINWIEALKEDRISQEFLDEQRQTLTIMEFKILYDADFPDDTEDALFKWEWIQNAIIKQ
jgi:hypothetical protein